jgi:succinate-semialdehyde dehydrogenase / glutarate-semialdehyde dehydrogenase
MQLISRNPATGAELGRYDELTPPEVDAAIARAHEAFLSWRARPVEERAELVGGLASTLRANKDELARLATSEMGKVLAEAEGEVEKSAWFCEYYAEQAPDLLAPRRIDGAQLENWIERAPLGPILAVMPWNFPYVQVFRFAPAILAAGNVVLLKHAPNVPGCALRIQELFAEAGFPPGAFQTLLSDVDAVEQALSDPRVRAVTLTGSERAGASVAAIAGRELKPCVLELGGSDPFVVLEDADVDHAAACAVTSRFTNAGQACINAKRLIVVDEVADAFEAAVIERTAALRVGDPTDPDTQIGPLAQPRFAEALRAQVEASVSSGARQRTGGFREGSWVDPIVLTGVDPSMRVFREETFGPVAPIARVSDEEAAIALANDSVYGLGASVWTADHERGRRVAAQIDAGMLFVNAVVVSDARLPFGGTKRSGYGRELGPWGLWEFTEVRSVAVSPAPLPA